MSQYSEAGPITFIQVLDRCIATPSAPAIYDSNGETYTYADLVCAAHAVANTLGTPSNATTEIVAVALPRCFNFIASLLGVWLSGRALVVVDILGLPEDRVELILRDCDVQHLLTSASLNEKIRPIIVRLSQRDLHPLVHIIGTTKTTNRLIPTPTLALLRSHCVARSQPPTTTLAYVVYTSGSTGRPKGVMVAHFGLMNLCDYYRNHRQLTSRDCLSQTISPGFDPIHEEIWPALTTGASLRIADEDTGMTPPLLSKWLATSGTTIALLPTPVAELVLQSEWPNLTNDSVFRLLICGGDVLKIQKPPHCWFTFDNHYGPSEATILATVFTIEASLQVPPPPPIGKPIPNTTLEIVDGDTLEPVQQGDWGEILLGGHGIALGYLNLPEKTAESFVERGGGGGSDDRGNDRGGGRSDRGDRGGGGRMYRTGDIGRVRDDGNVEFGGRVDLQVKIDGERIELGEIETCLTNAPIVKECAIDARAVGPTQKKQIVAYVVVIVVAEKEKKKKKEEEETTVSESNKAVVHVLKKYMATRLSSKMQPSHYVVMPKIPLTANGKIDRRNLPDPVPSTSSLSSPSSSSTTTTTPSLSSTATTTHTSTSHHKATKSTPSPTTSEAQHVSDVCDIVADVLGIDVKHVRYDTNVFELGASSSLAATMMLRVRETIDFDTDSKRSQTQIQTQTTTTKTTMTTKMTTTVKLNTLFAHPTPIQLVRHLTEKTRVSSETNKMSVLELNTEAESVLDLEFHDIPPHSHVPDTPTPTPTTTPTPRPSSTNASCTTPSPPRKKTILLTGGTGFLGAYLVRDLMSTSWSRDEDGVDVDVVCVVRAASNEAAKERVLKNLDKYGLSLQTQAASGSASLTCVCGDVTLPKFGLAKDVYDKLAQRVTSVYHCASMVHYAHSYETMKTANVIGTAHVLRFCIEGGTLKSLHYISTLGVYPVTQFNREEINESSIIDTHGFVATGYSQSKFVADALVRKFVERYPQRLNHVCLYRPARIVGDDNTGKGADDFLFKLLHLCLRVYCYPNDIVWDVDVTSVNSLSECIARLSTTPTSQDNNTNNNNLTTASCATIYHLHNQATQPFVAVCAWLSGRAVDKGVLQAPMESVPWSEWIRRCEMLLTSDTDTDDTVSDALKAFIPVLSSTACEFQDHVPFPLSAKSIRCTATATALALTHVRTHAQTHTQTHAQTRIQTNNQTNNHTDDTDETRSRARYALGDGWSTQMYFSLMEKCLTSLDIL